MKIVIKEKTEILVILIVVTRYFKVANLYRNCRGNG